MTVTAVGCGDNRSSPAVACVAANGVICTIAGTGIAGDGDNDMPATATRLYLPQDITIAPDGRLFIVDWNNHHVRARQPDGTLRIVAGIGEPLSPEDAGAGGLHHPTHVSFDASGRLVVAGWHIDRIKAVDLASGEMVDICGNGTRGFAGDGGSAAAATLNLPVAAVFDPGGNMIVADQGNGRLRRVDQATQLIATIAGVGPCAEPACPPLGDGGPALSARLSSAEGESARPAGRIDLDTMGNLLIADTTNPRVRKINSAGIITTLAGSGEIGASGDGGPATGPALNGPADVASGSDGAVYIADTGNSCVRVVRPNGIIDTVAGTCGSPGFAGDGGPATGGKLNRPGGIALDAVGNLYIADTHNQRVRVVYR